MSSIRGLEKKIFPAKHVAMVTVQTGWGPFGPHFRRRRRIFF